MYAMTIDGRQPMSVCFQKPGRLRLVIAMETAFAGQTPTVASNPTLGNFFEKVLTNRMNARPT